MQSSTFPDPRRFRRHVPREIPVPRSFPHHSQRIIFRTIDLGTNAPETGCMARYSAFLGRKVEVHYRAGDICLPASGIFMADSGRSIFLEQRFDQRGTQKTFRWEVPYAYIIRIEELPSESAGVLAPVLVNSAPESEPEAPAESAEPKASAAAAGAGGASTVLPFTHRPKMA